MILVILMCLRENIKFGEGRDRQLDHTCIFAYNFLMRFNVRVDAGWKALWGRHVG